MQWSRTLAGATSVLLGLLLCGEAYDSLALKDYQEQAGTQIILDGIRELAELVVLEVQLTEAVTATVSGRTGSTTAVVVITGSVTLAVDLELARIVEPDRERQNLVLALPQPTVRSVAIDHEASRVASCQRSGLWELAVGEAHEDRVIADAFAAGQRRLEAAGREERFAQRARHHTEAVIERFARDAGWTVEVRWE